ncbi:MAG: hydrogenase iron-sulfur subunit, partial [Candidatus Heimdallarchaeota archaeon]
MYKPKILGFLCNWCSYAGADLAGVSRLNYPPNLRVIRVMCSGRVDPIFIITAFKRGLDGVLVAGCHFGDCHYLSGNYHTKYKILMIKKILGKIGLEPKRLRLEGVSAAEGT